ncbi:MAG: flagellar hook-basal body complex protein [Candidatus Eremiobacteraeota bacterium]|nr:flagellar hook-basal body complex protein [Candidatus Eremiobacteraeota bacterium]
MYDGIKKATLGMQAMNQKQDVILNNLANVGTTGYRRENMTFSSFSEVMEKEMTFNPSPTKKSSEYQQAGIGVESDGMLYQRTLTSFSQGSLKNTGNTLDLALDDDGRGFFTIKTDKGLAFSRGGSFRIDNQGYLCTQDGSFVMGHKGKIQLGGSSVGVTNEGMIKVDGKEVDKLLVTEFNDKMANRGLMHSGDNNFQANAGGRIATNSHVKQGFLEMANVNAVQSMIELMTIMRAYEANQKTLQAEDKMIQKTVNETGKVR